MTNAFTPVVTEKNSVANVRCAVIGKPVGHSLSPRLHSAFAGQFSLGLNYQRIECDAHEFDSVVEQFFAQGGLGLNITLPYKQRAFALAKFATERAVLAQSANTLSWRDGRLHADNTDGSGLVIDLKRLGRSLANQNITVLGAGGAAAGILPALLAQHPAHLTLHNRTTARAHALVAQFNTSRLSVQSSATPPCDVLISTVSDGFEDLVATLRLAKQCYVYDLNYGARAQTVRDYAQENKLVMTDGLGMLIEQAAESFFLWHGLQPDTETVHQGQY